MKNKHFLIITACLFIAFTLDTAGADEILAPFKPHKGERLASDAVKIARRSVGEFIKNRRVITPKPGYHPALNNAVGVIVTIVKNGRPRGCMGTISPHEESAAMEIARSARLAATGDPFQKPVQARELPKLKYVVSLIGEINPVPSPSHLDVINKGILVRNGGRSALLLPGEALTTEWAIYRCKQKAGIPQNEPVELFTFKTITLGPE